MNKRMNIGLTYDLKSWYLERGWSHDDVAEFDNIEVIEGIENELNAQGFETRRIGNLFELTAELAKGNRWDMVFNICEGLYGDGRESAVPALLDQYRIPYVFSGPVVLGMSLNKYLTKIVVQARGVPTAPFRIVSTKGQTCSGLHYPLFVKPVSEGTGKGITEASLIERPEDLTPAIDNLLETCHQPVLVEEFLPGREFTAGIVGNGKDAKVVGIMEVRLKDGLVYTNHVKENYQEYARYDLLTDKALYAECEKVALDAWNAVGAVDAGRVDLRVDRSGKVCMIEINPLAGLHPVHSDLPILARLNHISYSELIASIMDASLRRLGLR